MISGSLVVPNATTSASRSRLEVLAEESGMARGDAQQGDCGPIGSPSTLLPVAQRVHADAHRSRELCLREIDEATQGSDVFARFELAQHQALSDPCGDGACQLFGGQL